MGRVWAGLGPFLALLGHVWGVRRRAFIQHWPTMGSKRPLGSIWGRFGCVWGGFWEGLGGPLGRFFCLLWLALACFGCFGCLRFPFHRYSGFALCWFIFRFFWLLWLIFAIFWRVLIHLAFFYYFFAILDRFLEVWGGFWEGFWEVFSMFWSNFLKNAKFVKYSILHRKNHGFLYVELLENNEKATKSASKVDANFE